MHRDDASRLDSYLLINHPPSQNVSNLILSKQPTPEELREASRTLGVPPPPKNAVENPAV